MDVLKNTNRDALGRQGVKSVRLGGGGAMESPSPLNLQLYM